MLPFKKLSLDDINVLRPLLTHTYSRLCDYTLCTLFMWRDYYSTEFAVHNNAVFLTTVVDTVTGMMLPIGGNLDRNLDTINKFYPKCRFYFLTEAEVELLKQHYPNCIVNEHEGNEEYFYDADAMSSLKGRKLHGKKNHVNYFVKTYKYRFEEITGFNVQRVRSFLEEIFIQNDKSSEFYTEGCTKTDEALKNLTELGLESLVLYVDDDIVGLRLVL